MITYCDTCGCLLVNIIHDCCKEQFFAYGQAEYLDYLVDWGMASDDLIIKNVEFLAGSEQPEDQWMRQLSIEILKNRNCFLIVDTFIKIAV